MALRTILLIRHAQSEEDINPSIHNLADDHEIKLTLFGIEQTKKLAHCLLQYLNIKNKIIYLSPSKRARETWNILNSYSADKNLVYVDKRIRNLNWGNITLETRKQIETERYKVGVLNYKFPGGDNTPDYIADICDFTKEMLYDCNKQNFPECIIIITHGFALRVIARSILNISDEEFKWLANPPNCYWAKILYFTQESRFVLHKALPTIKPIKQY